MKSFYFKLTGTLILAGFIVACGGGGGGIAGIGGSGYIATGSITGFGSVWVNRVEFHTDSSTTYEIEDQLLYDQLQEQTYLSEGMVVQIEGSINADGVSGIATKIRFGDNIEGPITSDITNPDGNELRFTVMSINVAVDVNNTKFPVGIDYNNLAKNNLIEISGYYDQNFVLHATYIKIKENIFDEINHNVELEGLISGFNGSTNFLVQGVSVNASAVSLSGLANGKYVEVKGHYIGSVLNASEIKTEELNLKDDGSDVSIEGYITRYVDNSDFEVNGIRVNALVLGDNVSFEPTALKTQLRVGLEVEVEGNIINGILIAKEVESEGGNAEIHAVVENDPISTDTAFQVILISGSPNTTVTVNVTPETVFEDGLANVGDLYNPNFIEVVGIEETGSNSMTATKIKLVSPDTAGDYILQGLAADATGNRTTGTITALGVTYDFDGTTVFENESDATMTETEVNALISAINLNPDTILVKIKDIDGNGMAEEIDLED